MLIRKCYKILTDTFIGKTELVLFSITKLTLKFFLLIFFSFKFYFGRVLRVVVAAKLHRTMLKKREKLTLRDVFSVIFVSMLHALFWSFMNFVITLCTKL